MRTVRKKDHKEHAQQHPTMTGTAETDNTAGNVTSQMARGVVWMMLLKFAVRGLGLISTLILVRLLSPKDFGLVAMATVFIGIMDVFSWFSFDMVLIQKQTASREHYDTAWTYNVIFKTISTLVLLACAYPASLYYDEPRVTAIMAILAAGVFLGGFENIGIVNFRKNMQFNRDFQFMFLRKFSGFIVTVPLAFIFRSYWALIIGMTFSRVFTLVLSYAMESYRPRFSLAARHDLFDFSKWLFLNNVFYAFRMRSAELIIGRVSGAQALGLFTVSYEISNMPTTELVAPINRAVFPGYAKMSSDLSALRNGYLNVISMIALFAIPAGAGIAATAQLLVPVALGEQWLAATPLIAVLGFYGVVTALQTNIASVYMAIGRPQVLTALHALHLVVLLSVAIPATLKFGIHGAALSYLGVSLLLLPVNYAVMFRTISLPALTFLARIWRPLAAAIVMYFAVRELVDYVMVQSHASPNVLHFLIVCFAGALVYSLMILLTWWWSGQPTGAERYSLNVLRSRFGRKKTPATRG